MTFQEEDIDTNIFSNALATRLGPVNYRPVLGSDEALGEDIVGNMSQTFKMNFVQFDALSGGQMRMVAMNVDVAEPEAGWCILFKARLMIPNT